MAALGSGCPDGTKGTLDEDEDGWGVDDDCDDAEPDVNPGVTEVCGNGIDDNCDGTIDCIVDDDGDGYAAPDDCDDSEPLVNPGEPEDCYTPEDEDCNGIATECLDPHMIYEPTSPGSSDPYGAAVFADLVVFGEPGSVFAIGDGEALFFELEEGTVDELDAVITSEGAVGEAGAYGTVLTPVGDDLCINADYQDAGSGSDAGKSWCFSESTIDAAGGSLPLTNASYTVAGEDPSGYAKVGAQADVDGDAELDLLVYTSKGVHVILGDGTPWSGDYSVPSGADLTLGSCAGSTTGWCGFARALNENAPSTLALSGEGGTPDSISLYTLPLVGGSTAPTANALVDRVFGDSATGVELISGSAFGNSAEGEVVFLDGAGAVEGVLSGPSGLGFWSSTVFDLRGHELLLVSNPNAQAPGSAGVGVVYVYDLTTDGLPTDTDAARYRLVPPSGFFDCGWRARGGIVTTEDGSWTTVVVSCPGFGGAAYVLDHLPPPLPLIGPAGIVATDPSHFEIRQWVVQALTSRPEWIASLAQTEVVVAGGAIVGWRLHAIEPGSPLYRAGLRNGDVLRRVNGIDVTTPAVVRALYDAFVDASELTVGITRNGIVRQLHYAIVP